MGEQAFRGAILVVEDHQETRYALRDILSDEGYAVAVAADGAAALKWLHEHSPPCLILLDMMMPVMDGREFLIARHLEPTLASVPVVAFSAGSHRDPRVSEGLEGVLAFLHKPLDLDDLFALVEKICGRPPSC